MVVGLSAPVVNYLITGHPLPLVLPAMTIELAFYGGMTGLIREQLKFSTYLSVTIGLLAGRVAFLTIMFVGGAYRGEFWQYAYIAMLPGLLAGVAQIVLLPRIAELWIKKARAKGAVNHNV